MRLLIITILILNTLSFAIDNKNSDDKRIEKNIKEQLEREKKYSKEQTFYKGKYYDLKGSEVDENSVKSLPEQVDTNADFDMDSTYD